MNTFMNFMCSILCINTDLIRVCNTSKCAYKHIYNIYCFLFLPTCFGHTLTIFRFYFLVLRVHLKMCGSPYNFCVKTSGCQMECCILLDSQVGTALQDTAFHLTTGFFKLLVSLP
jgi:hypothetical protein